MSYSIIFKTVIVKLDDGRIVHFNRSGCNNDNAGRQKDEFSAHIFADKNDFRIYAERFLNNSLPYKEGGEFNLKLLGRNASYYDYGAHLLRMLNRALTIDQLSVVSPRFNGRCVDYFQVYEPEEKIVFPKDFDNYFWNAMKNGGIRYKTFFKTLYSLEEIIELCDKGVKSLTDFNFFI